VDTAAVWSNALSQWTQQSCGAVRCHSGHSSRVDLCAATVDTAVVWSCRCHGEQNSRVELCAVTVDTLPEPPCGTLTKVFLAREDKQF
jgi:hypothetical protein